MNAPPTRAVSGPTPSSSNDRERRRSAFSSLVAANKIAYASSTSVRFSGCTRQNVMRSAKHSSMDSALASDFVPSGHRGRITPVPGGQ